jgi:hypothetical protein
VKRTFVLAAAWTASAATAVGLGFLAVSLVDASVSPGGTRVAASTTSATYTAPAASPTSGAASGEHVTVGGTVFASCLGGAPSLAAAPSPGWRVDDSDDPGHVQFENGTQKVEVHTVCVGDVPQFSDEGPRADDSGHDGGSGAPSSASEHGSDDHAGDDSAGRDGGGHGSDG